ncbi:MAG TPA: phosphatidylglycerol lysyltransferase domain-containing protein [Gaiellaceae bacterium]|nr:phosphatidylglycerol lysyltransferase domain-containing protein [Gaiellaceae bacterium]
MEGAVAYLEQHGVALVWADPIAAPADAEALLAEATAELRGRKLRTCLILVGDETATHALAAGYAVLKIGEQPFFSLAEWRQPRGDPGKHLRWCLNRAARAGVAVRAYEPHDEHGAADVLLSWERGLGHRAAQSFLRASPLTLAGEKRLFVAELRGRIEAIVACTPAAGGRWFLEDLVRRPTAPMGATEALVVETLRRLAADGAGLAWMDIAPLRGSSRQLDGRAQLLFRAAQPAISLFDSRYRFRALTTYLEKFVPTGWAARYVALNPAWPTPRVIRAVSALL